MPPQEIPQNVAHRFTVKALIQFLIVLILIAGFAFAWYVTMVNEQSAAMTPLSSASQQQSATSSVATQLQSTETNFSSGSYAAALQQYQDYESSTTISDADKAAYKAYDFGVTYRASGKLSDLLNEIDAVKQDVIQNAKLYTFVRATGINEIATAYAWTGENQTVFQEVFKGSSYQNFLAANNDPDLSIRNLFQWSWSLQPTSMAGGWLAGLNMNYVLSHPELTEAQKQTYITQTEAYIKAADAIEAKDPSPQIRPDYAGYLFWEAFAYGALAHEVGGTYQEQYKTKYQDLISFLQQQNSVPNLQWEPYADYFYAVFLVLNDNDMADAQVQLGNAVALVKADPNPAMNEFSNYVRNKQAQAAQSGTNTLDFKAKQLSAMASISPTFKSFMSGLAQ